MRITFLFLVFIICSFSFATAQRNDDEITNLPGYVGPEITFKNYAGYLQVNETKGRFLFYWFAESQNDPKSDPLVVWLNGGPGCSSLLGLLTEHGPFTILPNKTLVPNPHSWNKVANMLYIEAPAGVGFSYSNDKSDYQKGNLYDDKTAHDNYVFLGKFFQKYPQFSSNELFISGESYGGHYVPTFTNAIHDGNEAGTFPKMNLKGFLVGNGVIDNEADSNSVPPFMKEHAFIGIQFYNVAYKACQGDFYKNQNIPECRKYLDEILVTCWGAGINPYNLYADCQHSRNVARAFERKRLIDHTMHPLFTISSLMVRSSPPCIDGDFIESYLNTDSVKQAIHARNDIKWTMCSDVVGANYDWQYETMIPFYEKLLKYYRAIFYSGDIDGAVNVMGSQASFLKLNTTESTDLKLWHFGGQVAGAQASFGPNLRFITVKGAGHMVPTDRPEQAFHIFSQFLKNQPI